MVEVVTTEQFSEWINDLDAQASKAAARSIGLLAATGTLLGFPHSSAIAGASFALRELRVQAGGRPIRIFYAFDPKRQAVLLIGGDKTGDKRFYETMTRNCERLWKEYLDENP